MTDSCLAMMTSYLGLLIYASAAASVRESSMLISMHFASLQGYPIVFRKRLYATRTYVSLPYEATWYSYVPVTWVRGYTVLVLQALTGDVPLDPVSACQRKQRDVGDTWRI